MVGIEKSRHEEHRFVGDVRVRCKRNALIILTIEYRITNCYTYAHIVECSPTDPHREKYTYESSLPETNFIKGLSQRTTLPREARIIDDEWPPVPCGICMVGSEDTGRL